MKMLFIVPVHENNECLWDTLNNITKYNPDIEPLFAVYVSDFFRDFDEAGLLERFPNALVTRRLRQHFNYRYESQIESLIKTYRIAREHFKEFDYAMVFHTSQLFVRQGFADYIKNFDYAYTDYVAEPKLPNRYHALIWNKVFINYFPDIGDQENYEYCVVESMFFKKTVLDWIEMQFNKLPFDLSVFTREFAHTPVEEIVIPTLAAQAQKQLGLERSEGILHFHGPIETMPEELQPSHFTIKSVPRALDHPLRIFARHQF